MTAVHWDYVALDAAGAPRNGTVAATSEAEAAQIVRTLGLRPTRLTTARPPLLQREFSLPSFDTKVKPGEVAGTIRQLSTMLGAGVTMRRALTVLVEQATNDSLRTALAGVKDDVEAGESLSAAMDQHPKAFGPVVVALVRAGESAGALDTVLDQAADTLERQAALRSKVRSTLAYPVSVLVLVALVLVAMSVFVVPVFRGVYEDLGQELPMITQVVLAITGFIGSNVMFIALFVALGVVAFRKYRATDDGRRKVDRFLLRIPGLGDLLRQAALARTARSLSVLVGAGVPLLDAVDITASAVGNDVLADVIRDTGEAIQSGRPLSEPLTDSDEIPALFAQVIAVGEEAGDLEEMLEVVAGVYDDGVDSVSATFSAVIEPAMIAGLGAVVGGLVLSLYLPMFRLVDIVQ